MPKTILVCGTRNPPVENDLLDARKRWAFSDLSPELFASFQPPPSDLDSWKLSKKREPLWKHFDKIEGRYTPSLVKGLCRRCLELACYDAGLVWCPDRQLLYFPAVDNPQRRVASTNLDGKRTTVSVAGIRQFGFGVRAQPYHYQLAPIFRVGFDDQGDGWVTTRIYARVTELNGTALTGKAIGSRRKHLARSWWNQHWLARTLGVMQALANESREIVVDG